MAKKRNSKAEQTSERYVGPSSMVFRSGSTAKSVRDLVYNMRHVMEPHTAIRLEVS
jgi:hypothetical protein